MVTPCSSFFPSTFKVSGQFLRVAHFLEHVTTFSLQQKPQGVIRHLSWIVFPRIFWGSEKTGLFVRRLADWLTDLPHREGGLVLDHSIRRKWLSTPPQFLWSCFSPLSSGTHLSPNWLLQRFCWAPALSGPKTSSQESWCSLDGFCLAGGLWPSSPIDTAQQRPF